MREDIPELEVCGEPHMCNVAVKSAPGSRGVNIYAVNDCMSARGVPSERPAEQTLSTILSGLSIVYSLTHATFTLPFRLRAHHCHRVTPSCKWPSLLSTGVCSCLNSDIAELLCAKVVRQTKQQ